MVDYVDMDFINRLSSRLDRYRVVNQSPLKVNFRCPICGDSKKSKQKSRGWILEKENRLSYYCHNCFASFSFQNFIKELDGVMYDDYITTKFMNGRENRNKNNFTQKGVVESTGGSRILSIANTIKVETPEEIPEEEEGLDPNLKTIRNISDLSPDHPAVLYLISREIPQRSFDRLYYAPKFKKWVNSIIPDKFPEFSLNKDEPRLILPFLDENGKMFGFTGRSFDPDSELRYMSIMIDDKKDKFFGLDFINSNIPYFVLEGGIDSFHAGNAMAMAGADAKLENLPNKDNAIIVYDNEPRNAEIHKKMESAIEKGFRIVIWPDNITQKDLNNMVTKGRLSESYIIQTMEENVFHGLTAKLVLDKWKKVEKKKRFNVDDDNIKLELKKEEVYKW